MWEYKSFELDNGVTDVCYWSLILVDVIKTGHNYNLKASVRNREVFTTPTSLLSLLLSITVSESQCLPCDSKRNHGKTARQFNKPGFVLIFG